MEESQGETATAHFPEQMWEYHPSYGKDKSLYARMAELLWNSGHEEQHRKHERMLYRRIRMCIWKQWKLPKTRKRKLMGLGMPEWVACEGAYSRKSYWRMSNTGVVKRALTKERLINWGYYDIATAYQSLHVNY